MLSEINQSQDNKYHMFFWYEAVDIKYIFKKKYRRKWSRLGYAYPSGKLCPSYLFLAEYCDEYRDQPGDTEWIEIMPWQKMMERSGREGIALKEYLNLFSLQ